MTGSLLIDVTDPRFSIPENADVLAFIRRANPFAHSDVGSLLFDLARDVDGVEAYCPAPTSCAYVVLHTPTDRIVAIADAAVAGAFAERCDAREYLSRRPSAWRSSLYPRVELTSPDG